MSLSFKRLKFRADMSNSIETAIAIAFFGTIAIDIAIAKAIFKLLPLQLTLLLLLLNSMRDCKTHCHPGRSGNDLFNKYFLGNCTYIFHYISSTPMSMWF